MPLQLQSAFDSCKLPAPDRVSLSGVLELAQDGASHDSSLPVVSTLCHAWLRRMRSKPELAALVDPVAAAVTALLPAPISGGGQAWGVQPHQSSSSWMATWRMWRSVANALHMSGILTPKLPNDVIFAPLALIESPIVVHAACRAAHLGI